MNSLHAHAYIESVLQLFFFFELLVVCVSYIFGLISDAMQVEYYLLVIEIIEYIIKNQN